MKIKQKLINISASLLLMIYPLAFANAVYAIPEIPGVPEIPSVPTIPGTPNIPAVPRQDQQTAAPPTDSGTNQPSGHHRHGNWNSSNSNTGADSTNNTETNADNNSDTNINNEAGVDNAVSVDSLTGDNDADKNTGDGVIATGRAGINGSLSTSANRVSLGGLECSTECGLVSLADLNSSNSNTGSGSSNNASTTSSNDSFLGINNDADFNNLVDFDANSGDNSASKNTGSGIITTGDAEIILTAINTANDVNVGVEVFNFYDDQTGDLVIDYSAADFGGVGGGLASSNNTTGANSINNASTNVNNTNTILIDNLGNVINNYQLDANTGDNTADKNTGDGSITTGNANVVFNLINLLNNAFLGTGQLLLGVVNIFGTLSGDIVLQGLEGTNGINPYLGSSSASNDSTGADSTNDASSNLSNNTDIGLTNSAEILNNISLNATTGNNDASENTGGGLVSTGDVNANLKVTNIANTNTIGSGGGTIWLVLVNNLGTWTGQLFGSDGTSGAYSPFFTFTINPDGSLSAANNTTGADSTNNASTAISNDTDISITNTATLTNNVTIDANTGGNSASKNTGSGTISTGNVNVAANIVNIINNNFIGGRFVITIVNIFGKLLGDIRQGDAGSAVAAVSQEDSFALSANNLAAVNNSPINTAAAAGINTGSPSGSDGSSGDNQSALVLGTADSDGTGNSPISYFNSNRGLLDGFRLEYLLIPILFGVALTLTRRALRLR